MSKSPLKVALEVRDRPKTCADCPDRTNVKGVSYCKKDGKILHPMLLVYPYAECPIEQKRQTERMKANQ